MGAQAPSTHCRSAGQQVPAQHWSAAQRSGFRGQVVVCPSQRASSKQAFGASRQGVWGAAGAKPQTWSRQVGSPSQVPFAAVGHSSTVQQPPSTRTHVVASGHCR